MRAQESGTGRVAESKSKADGGGAQWRPCVTRRCPLRALWTARYMNQQVVPAGIVRAELVGVSNTTSFDRKQGPNARTPRELYFGSSALLRTAFRSGVRRQITANSCLFVRAVKPVMMRQFDCLRGCGLVAVRYHRLVTKWLYKTKTRPVSVPDPQRQTRFEV
jgi:hypothetical protein